MYKCDFDVGAIVCDVGAIVCDVGAIDFDVGAIDFDVGAIDFDVGAIVWDNHESILSTFKNPQPEIHSHNTWKIKFKFS